MRRFVLLILVACVASAEAQPGLPDPTFGTDGLATFAGAGDGSGNAVLPLPDGAVLVGGEDGGDGVVLRYTAAGALDGAFGDGGVVRLPRLRPSPPFRGVVRALARDAGGGTLVLYEEIFDNGFPEAGFVIRLLGDGALDPAYGEAGIVSVTPVDRPAVTALVALPGGGCALLNSPVPSGEPTTPFVLQLRADGSPDPAFGTDGVAPITSPALRDETSFRALARFPDGRLALVGFRLTTFFNFEAVAFQLTPEGVPDPAFGGGDLVAFPTLDTASYFTAAAVDADGRLAVAGFASNDAGTRIVVGRLLDDGAPDPSFDADGFRLDARTPVAGAFALAPQADGRLVVAGATGGVADPRAVVARYTADGKRDATFGADDGLTTLTYTEGAIARAVALRSTGEIVVAGSLQQRNPSTPAGTPIGLAVAQLVNDGVPPTTAAPGPDAAGTLALGSPAPHPVRAATRIPVTGARGPVRVEAFDVQGRRVALVHDGPAPERGVRLDVAAWPPGVYLLRATDGRSAATRRVVRM